MTKNRMIIVLMVVVFIVVIFGVNQWASKAINDTVSVPTAPKPVAAKAAPQKNVGFNVKDASVQELIDRGLIDPAVEHPEKVILEEAPAAVRGHLLQ